MNNDCRCAGAILDLDGVITQTAKVHFQAWKQTFDGYLYGESQGFLPRFHLAIGPCPEPLPDYRHSDRVRLRRPLHLMPRSRELPENDQWASLSTPILPLHRESPPVFTKIRWSQH